ncbi:MAG: hypothetical protein MZW92_66460 [Comamonadaceae bacterium]|nr:hypothetical protein [Comamonadaceae bacterium]
MLKRRDALSALKLALPDEHGALVRRRARVRAARRRCSRSRPDGTLRADRHRHRLHAPTRRAASTRARPASGCSRASRSASASATTTRMIEDPDFRGPFVRDLRLDRRLRQPDRRVHARPSARRWRCC